MPKSKFPADAVYGSSERPVLVLVTCGGSYETRPGLLGQRPDLRPRASSRGAAAPHDEPNGLAAERAAEIAERATERRRRDGEGVEPVGESSECSTSSADGIGTRSVVAAGGWIASVSLVTTSASAGSASGAGSGSGSAATGARGGSRAGRLNGSQASRGS